jgi:hypothetical protein
MSDTQNMFYSQLTNLLVLRNDHGYREAIRRLNNDGLTRYRNEIFVLLSLLKGQRQNISIPITRQTRQIREDRGIQFNNIEQRITTLITEDSKEPRRQWDIYAIKCGTVSTENNHTNYGTATIIEDSNGIRVLYAHLASRYVSQGRVNEGDPIGVMGNTGNSSGVHLHLGVYPSGTKDFDMRIAINPENYIRSGTYPCNTLISNGGRFGRPRTLNGIEYKHEGIDFSGNPSNMMPGWQRNGFTGVDGLEKNTGRG